MSGWVYIIANQAMPGVVKVGFTERHPSDRADDFNRQHYRAAIPFRFVVAYAAWVKDPRWLERETHNALGKYRVTKQTRNRKDEKEWFRCGVGEATAAIRWTASRFQWLIGSIQEEIGPFETEAEIEKSTPESSPVSFHDTIEQIRLANEHWLNRKALALLKENHIPVSSASLHIMTLLYEFSEYSDGGRWREVREFRDGWSLDEILRVLDDCPPEKIIRFLIGDLIHDDDEEPTLCEEDMDRVNGMEDMLDLLWEPIDEFLTHLDDCPWVPDECKRWC